MNIFNRKNLKIYEILNKSLVSCNFERDKIALMFDIYNHSDIVLPNEIDLSMINVSEHITFKGIKLIRDYMDYNDRGYEVRYISIEPVLRSVFRPTEPCLFF